MIKLTDEILHKLGGYRDSHFFIFSPDFKFLFLVKRADQYKYAVRMKRNNTKIFLRYVTYLSELNQLFKAICDKELKFNKS